MDMARLRFETYQTRLQYLSPAGRIRDMRQQTADYEEKLPALMAQKILESRQELAVRIERMKGLSPLERLNQGFSYVEGSNGKAVKRIGDVKSGDELTIFVTDGRIRAEVRETGKEVYDGRRKE